MKKKTTKKAVKKATASKAKPKPKRRVVITGSEEVHQVRPETKKHLKALHGDDDEKARIAMEFFRKEGKTGLNILAMYCRIIVPEEKDREKSVKLRSKAKARLDDYTL